jgi:hypothetical protein
MDYATGAGSAAVNARLAVTRAPKEVWVGLTGSGDLNDLFGEALGVVTVAARKRREPLRP